MKPHITALIRAILALAVICVFISCADGDRRPAASIDGGNDSKLKSFDTISPEAFMNPPLEARPGAYWCWLNGTVKEVGEVSIDGQDLGTVWNNRLVGDRFLPEEKRITRTNMQGQHTKNSPLVPSGLIGPVTLRPVKQN